MTTPAKPEDRPVVRIIRGDPEVGRERLDRAMIAILTRRHPDRTWTIHRPANDADASRAA